MLAVALPIVNPVSKPTLVILPCAAVVKLPAIVENTPAVPPILPTLALALIDNEVIETKLLDLLNVNAEDPPNTPASLNCTCVFEPPTVAALPCGPWVPPPDVTAA